MPHVTHIKTTTITTTTTTITSPRGRAGYQISFVVSKFERIEKKMGLDDKTQNMGKNDKE